MFNDQCSMFNSKNPWDQRTSVSRPRRKSRTKAMRSLIRHPHPGLPFPPPEAPPPKKESNTMKSDTSLILGFKLIYRLSALRHLPSYILLLPSYIFPLTSYFLHLPSYFLIQQLAFRRQQIFLARMARRFRIQ